jgi:natural product precursor
MAMKTLSKIKLNQFRKDELEKREMNVLKGGCECVGCACVCFWDNTNSSTSSDNIGVNHY